MSDQQQSVWPDGAREAVQGARYSWNGMYDDLAGAILTALEPFVQQRIAEATKTLGLQLHEAETRNGITGGVYTELYALRAEVARLREDGERLDWLEKAVPNGDFRRLVDSGKVPSVWPSTVRGFIDAARSAPGGDG